jgi:hypothetical protein
MDGSIREIIMSRFTRTALLAIAAITSFVASFPVNAAKPDKQHVMTTPPLRGVMVTCNASNLTAEPLEVYFDLPNQDGDTTQGLSVIAAGEVVGWTQYNNMMTSWTYCTLSWFGQKEDVRGTICLHDTSPPFVPYSCLSAD